MGRAEEGEREPANAGDAVADHPHAETAGVPDEPAQAGEEDSDVPPMDPPEERFRRLPPPDDVEDGLVDDAQEAVQSYRAEHSVEQIERRALLDFATRLDCPFPVPVDEPVAQAARKVDACYDNTPGKAANTRMRVITWIEKQASDAHRLRSDDAAQRRFVLDSLWSACVGHFPQFDDQVRGTAADAFRSFVEAAGNRTHRGKRTPTKRKWVAAGELLRALGLGGAIAAHTDGDGLRRQVLRARKKMVDAGLL